jgi:hypothetical protein
MPVIYEDYCKMNGISNIKKRPGKLAAIDRQKVLKKFAYAYPSDVTVTIQPYYQFRVSKLAEEFHGDSLLKAKELFEYDMEGK